MRRPWRCLSTGVQQIAGVHHMLYFTKANDQWAVEVTARDLWELGYTQFTYKSDQEPAIVVLKRSVVARFRVLAAGAAKQGEEAIKVIFEESGVSAEFPC